MKNRTKENLTAQFSRQNRQEDHKNRQKNQIQNQQKNVQVPYQFFKIKTITTDIQEVLTRFANAGIYINFNKNLSKHSFFVELVENSRYQQITQFHIRMGPFTTIIQVLNQNKQSFIDQLRLISSGSFGVIYSCRYEGKNLAVKKIYHSLSQLQRVIQQIKKIQKFKNMNLYEKLQKLKLHRKKKEKIIQKLSLQFLLCIRQVAILKIASALKIGPWIPQNLFDIIYYKDCFVFFMEQCSFEIIKISSLNKCKQDLRKNLQTMHEFNLIHNDIKPENIVFSPYYQKFVFIDFGCSRIISESVGFKTFVQKFSGTFVYATKQMQKIFREGKGRQVDLYCNDQYSLQKSISQIQEAFINKGLNNEKQQNYQIPQRKQKIFHQINRTENIFNRQLQLNQLKYTIFNCQQFNLINNLQSIQKYRVQLIKFILEIKRKPPYFQSLLIVLGFKYAYELQQMTKFLAQKNNEQIFYLDNLQGKTLSSNQTKPSIFSKQAKAIFSFLFAYLHPNLLVGSLIVLGMVTKLLNAIGQVIEIDPELIKKINHLKNDKSTGEWTKKQRPKDFIGITSICFEIICQYLNSPVSQSQQRIVIYLILKTFILGKNSQLTELISLEIFFILLNCLEVTFYEKIDMFTKLVLSELHKLDNEKTIEQLVSLYSRYFDSSKLQNLQLDCFRKCSNLVQNYYQFIIQKRTKFLNSFQQRVKKSLEISEKICQSFYSLFSSRLWMVNLKCLIGFFFHKFQISVCIFEDKQSEWQLNRIYQLEKLNSLKYLLQILPDECKISIDSSQKISNNMLRVANCKLDLNLLIQQTKQAIESYNNFKTYESFIKLTDWKYLKHSCLLTQKDEVVIVKMSQIIQEILAKYNKKDKCFSMIYIWNVLQQCLFVLLHLQTKFKKLKLNKNWTPVQQIIKCYEESGLTSFQYHLFYLYYYLIQSQLCPQIIHNLKIKQYCQKLENNGNPCPFSTVCALYQLKEKQKSIELLKKLIFFLKIILMQKSAKFAFSLFKFEIYSFQILIKQNLRQEFLELLLSYASLIKQQSHRLQLAEKLIIHLDRCIDMSTKAFYKWFYSVFNREFYLNHVNFAPFLAHFHMVTLCKVIPNKKFKKIIQDDFKNICNVIQYLPLKPLLLSFLYRYICYSSFYRNKNPRLHKFYLRRYIHYQGCTWQYQQSIRNPKRVLKTYEYFIKFNKTSIIHQFVKKKQNKIVSLLQHNKQKKKNKILR